jgi:hypothetical protein
VIRLGMMLAAAVAMSTVGSTAHAKMAVQTFHAGDPNGHVASTARD